MNEPSASDAHPPPGTEGTGLPEGRLTGRLAFAEAVRQALASAAARGWTELWLVDDHFAGWPLGERAVVQSLQDWARRGRQLCLLAREVDTLRRAHPRFVGWCSSWQHLVEARTLRQASPHELPGAIWTPEWTLERLDPVRFTQVATHASERRVALRERLGEWWNKGQPALAPTTLGL